MNQFKNPKSKNIKVNDQFGCWTVIDVPEKIKNNRDKVLCICNKGHCDNKKYIQIRYLLKSNRTECNRCCRRKLPYNIIELLKIEYPNSNAKDLGKKYGVAEGTIFGLLSKNKISKNRNREEQFNHLKQLVEKRGGVILFTLNEYKGNDFKYKVKCKNGHVSRSLGSNLVEKETFCKECGYLKNRKDIANIKFNRLLALERTGIKNKSSSLLWKCKCDCGNYCKVSVNKLTSGHTKSCGCLAKELQSKIGKTIGIKNFIKGTGHNRKPLTKHYKGLKRIVKNHRSQLWGALRRVINKSLVMPKVDYLGCDFNRFMEHLASQFQPGMTWENYGINGWHIDHIKPLDCFNLTKEKNRKIAFNYKNMQPLWAKDNLKKSNKV